MAESKLNIAWKLIFEQEDVLSHIKKNGSYDITATKIKKITGEEARLMTKVDFKENLPDIMEENGLSILAIENGVYRISNANPFRDTNVIESKNVKVIVPNKNYKTIDPYNISSESQALDICYINGILDEVFGEKTNLTIRGRKRNEIDLNFKIDGVDFNVKGVQIEIDGGYEGQEAIHLVEAKIGSRGNINIRQLLYPELYWNKKVPNKPKKVFLLYYEDPYFYFFPFVSDKDEFCKVDYAKVKTFRFKPQKEVFELYSIQIDEKEINYDAPFPQADDFKKILAMLSYIGNGITSKSELLLEFDFVDRQKYYYLSTLIWMNLCTGKGDKIILTDRGNQLFNMTSNERLQEMAKIVFSNKVFNDALKKGMNGVNDKDFETQKKYSDSTKKRRKQTVKSWVDFFQKNLVG